jgi:DNA-binding response OmpR family regulator
MMRVLWIDDEIDLLKPLIIFLENKGYELDISNNGVEGIEMFKNNNYSAVLLDENMIGLSGLEVLNIINELDYNIPIIMITKSEEENIMEDAIGNKISDYLIKPVNPNQILLSLKKALSKTKLVSERTLSNYQQEFRKISTDLSYAKSYQDWINLYLKLIYWELQLNDADESTMEEILISQKTECNNSFSKFIDNNYENWVNGFEDKPLLSNSLLSDRLIKDMSPNQKTLFIVIDNLRYDQWKTIEPNILKYYNKLLEKPYFSILPTATQYARNALFSGLMPLEIKNKFPQYWKFDHEDGGKNLYENELLQENLKKLGLSNLKNEYIKITNLKNGKKLEDEFKSKSDNDLITLVYNFVDMLSHSKTEMEMIKELASNDKSYRSLTTSWFNNSPLMGIIKQAAELNFKLIITTDHGTINVKTPTKVIGNKDLSSNLRYKTGKSLSFNYKEVVSFMEPNKIGLPSVSINSPFIFAKEDSFFAYPNNFNHYVSYFKDTYQHGGISMEEMIIPYVVLDPK